ncbi:MAG: SAP domain-containing protein [Thaumarchaeota archaeon]|nr:SAP domain-containing protein [Nitrososphaerota archaeon]
MGLSVKKLLDDYFRADEVQDALRDIGEPTLGSKDELVQRLRNNWESHNRDIYELLDFTDEETLEEICYYYNLDATPADHSVIKRRIKKANLLGSGKKPISQVSRSHDSFVNEPKIRTDQNSETPVHINIGSITHSKWGRIGVGVGIISIIVTIIFSM